MTTDTIAQAKELIERFDGKITEGEWLKIEDWFYGTKHLQIVLKEEDQNKENLTTHERIHVDCEAISEIPQMLTIIKELVQLVEKEKQQAMFVIVAEQEENQALKQRIAELEGGE
ncbi:hypothetical protein [Caudoviricetes sp.]|nr:hypothetical protein [Caudoviricetes sp.]